MAEQLTIPEDPRLAQRIRHAASRGALGHSVILSGQGDLLRAARFLAAAMECESENKPCGQCPSCRKVLRDIHPDVITVTDPEHKNISMDILRQIRSDAYVLPNEGRRKVYIFPDCDIFEPKTQNIFLKVLEEGPSHAAFLFCTRNSASLLQTIRSRSVEWKLSAVEENTPPMDQGANQLCRLLCDGKAAEITAFCTDLENSKISREELQKLLSDARDIVCSALAACYGAGGDNLAAQMARAMGRKRLAAAADILQTFIRQCGYNIGVGHLTGALAVELNR